MIGTSPFIFPFPPSSPLAIVAHPHFPRPRRPSLSLSFAVLAGVFVINMTCSFSFSYLCHSQHDFTVIFPA